MKKILAMAAVAALAAGASAYAANPFADVSTSDWAYQAVSDLSDQGIVEGYPDGTFKGQTNITRYEMAQIIARLMAKEDQYNAEQRATIDKLAGEYADELDSLGVRVSNLEKKVGNISWSGDARMRYQSNDNSGDEGWNGRIRINMKGQVNEKTTVNARLTTDNVNFKGSDEADVGMEALNVKHDFGAWDVTLGRYGMVLGNQGGWLYNSSWGFDGAQVAAEFGNIHFGAADDGVLRIFAQSLVVGLLEYTRSNGVVGQVDPVERAYNLKTGVALVDHVKAFGVFTACAAGAAVAVVLVSNTAAQHEGAGHGQPHVSQEMFHVVLCYG